MNITGLGRASLQVRDLAASERFYSHVLRMPVVSRCGQGSRIGFRIGKAYELVLEPIHRSADANTTGSIGAAQIAFVIGNNPRKLHEAAQHLSEQGVPFEQVSHAEYESLYLRDPDGHLIELYYWPEW